jgi:hypothetical protein
MMSINPSDKGYSGRSSSFWTAGRWFVLLILLLLISIGAYLYTHNNFGKGYQLAQFSSAHIDQLNRILYNASLTAAPAPQRDTARVADTSLPDSLRRVVQSAEPQPVTMQICDDTCKINKALLYVRTEFDNRLQQDQEDVIKAYISTFSAQEVGSYLAQLKLKVRSYFWLSGPFMYLEMIFWVIFGVICSNLFALGNLGRTRGFTAFDSREVPYQAAQFFYGPFCTIMLILAYNYIRHKDVIEVHATEGMIVFSFIAGLFSGRMMSFLERFKDALLPENIKEPAVAPQVIYQQPPVAGVKPVSEQPVKKSGLVTTVQEEATRAKPTGAEGAEDKQVINDLYKEQPEPADGENELVISDSIAFTAAEEEALSIPDIPAQAPATEPAVIQQVVIMINLDLSGLYEEEKNEILDVGFANAIVTMHNVNGRDMITARKSDDKYKASFVAAGVKPGIYIMRCTLTQKLSDDYTINLFGEKTAYVTNENRILELFIKKYEAID